MKYFLIALTLFSLSACQKNPESSQNVGNNFNVQRLFEVDSCTVYRFYDDRTVYFTKCDGSKPTTSYTENCGKGCSRLMSN